MKRLIFLAVIFLILSCKETKKDTLVLNTACNTNSPITSRILAFSNIPFTNEAPYKVDFNIHTNIDGENYMEIKMKLAGGAHYVSPNSTVAYKGRFTLNIDKNAHLKPVGGLLERPESVEEFDPHPFVNGKINWVRIDTEYKQKLMVTNPEDFLVFGSIKFTIEPRCTLEKVPFVISQKDGKLKIEINNC